MIEDKTSVLKDLEKLAAKDGYKVTLISASDHIVALTFELEQSEAENTRLREALEETTTALQYCHKRMAQAYSALSSVEENKK